MVNGANINLPILALKKLFRQVNWLAPKQTSRLAKQSWPLDLKGMSRPGKGKGLNMEGVSGETQGLCLGVEGDGHGGAGWEHTQKSQKIVSSLIGLWMFQQGMTNVLKLQGGKGLMFAIGRGER